MASITRRFSFGPGAQPTDKTPLLKSRNEIKEQPEVKQNGTLFLGKIWTLDIADEEIAKDETLTSPRAKNIEVFDQIFQVMKGHVKGVDFKDRNFEKWYFCCYTTNQIVQEMCATALSLEAINEFAIEFIRNAQFFLSSERIPKNRIHTPFVFEKLRIMGEHFSEMEKKALKVEAYSNNNNDTLIKLDTIGKEHLAEIAQWNIFVNNKIAEIELNIAPCFTTAFSNLVTSSKTSLPTTIFLLNYYKEKINNKHLENELISYDDLNKSLQAVVEHLKQKISEIDKKQDLHKEISALLSYYERYALAIEVLLAENRKHVLGVKLISHEVSLELTLYLLELFKPHMIHDTKAKVHLNISDALSPQMVKCIKEKFTELYKEKDRARESIKNIKKQIKILNHEKSKLKKTKSETSEQVDKINNSIEKLNNRIGELKPRIKDLKNIKQDFIKAFKELDKLANEVDKIKNNKSPEFSRRSSVINMDALSYSSSSFSNLLSMNIRESTPQQNFQLNNGSELSFSIEKGVRSSSPKNPFKYLSDYRFVPNPEYKKKLDLMRLLNKFTKQSNDSVLLLSKLKLTTLNLVDDKQYQEAHDFTELVKFLAQDIFALDEVIVSNITLRHLVKKGIVERMEDCEINFADVSAYFTSSIKYTLAYLINNCETSVQANNMIYIFDLVMQELYKMRSLPSTYSVYSALKDTSVEKIKKHTNYYKHFPTQHVFESMATLFHAENSRFVNVGPQIEKWKQQAIDETKETEVEKRKELTKIIPLPFDWLSITTSFFDSTPLFVQESNEKTVNFSPDLSPGKSSNLSMKESILKIDPLKVMAEKISPLVQFDYSNASLEIQQTTNLMDYMIYVPTDDYDFYLMTDEMAEAQGIAIPSYRKEEIEDRKQKIRALERKGEIS